MTAIRNATAVLVFSSLALMTISSGGAATTSTAVPDPGSSRQVAALVAASPHIKRLPKDTDPALADVSSDMPNRYFKIPHTGCTTPTSCVYGDLTSDKTIVLFGDSHAWMWLPAIYPIAQEDGYKLILMYFSGCPAASVTYWDVTTASYATGCDSDRATALTEIAKLAPSVVLLASLTSRRYSAPNTLFTASQWQAGLEKTINQVQSKSTKVGIIGDIPDFNYELPQCLAAYPTSVQRCGVAIPDPIVANRGLQVAEIAAAKQTQSLYINTLPWMCTKTWCSPIIGHMIPDLNQWHIDATFARYLSKVLGLALSPVLSRSLQAK